MRLPVHQEFTNPHECGGKMCERGKIPRSPHRPLDRNGGNKPFPNDPDHQVDRGSADSRYAMDEACDLEGGDQPYDIRLDPFAHTHRVGEDQVFLEFPEITIMDAHRSELAETGVDSIDRLTTCDDVLDRPSAALDPLRSFGCQREIDAAPDSPPVIESVYARSDRYRHRFHRPWQVSDTEA